MNEKCQICGKHEVQWELKSTLGDESERDPIYKICSNCLDNLVNRNLSQKQFKNILKNGHSDNEYLLHEDFYDEDGNALQPMGE